MASQPSRPRGMSPSMASPSPVSPVSPIVENSLNNQDGGHGLFHFANTSAHYSLQDPSQTPDNISLQQEEKQLSPLAEMTSITPPTSGWEAGSVSQSESTVSSKWGCSPLSLLPCSNTWIFEIASITIAALAVAAIVVILAHYDNKPLSAWSSSVTPNAAIAILVTTATASMSVPLSSGLGQLKWMRFKQGYAPLSDMEDFDNASRGPLGSLILLLHRRGGVAGSFGAFVVVLVLLLSPLTQQIVAYPMRTVELPSGATTYRALTYSLIPTLPIKSAVYHGLSLEEHKPRFSPPFECPSGNCTFGEIETLGVCSSCLDMTEYLAQLCNAHPSNSTATNLPACSWVLPSGATLNTSVEVFSLTSSIPSVSASYSTLMRLSFLGVDQKGGNDRQPWAKQCTLSACVQRLDSRVRDGVFEETLISSFTNSSVPLSGGDKEAAVVMTSPVSQDVFTLPASSRTALQSALVSLFQNGSVSRMDVSKGSNDDEILQAFYQYASPPSSSPSPSNNNNIEALISAIATSITTALRSTPPNNAPISGTTTTNETFIKVRWGFIAIPVICVTLSGIFLVLTAWEAGKDEGAELWKGSVLAAMFHGVDEQARRTFAGEASLVEKRREARGIYD
ncbi:hypothetical protein B0T16DRAFT_447977 [Cercophora newfieldiana]|uniref:Uncharacterized protein n=1 Tax=Cercophora newfieldiana TaxID=92897 RepID=A0AA39Y371_9PEZI|nr:hypothetical protein B0T16DRAFT_447977 [Cercophora newfieldiana]